MVRIGNMQGAPANYSTLGVGDGRSSKGKTAVATDTQKVVLQDLGKRWHSSQRRRIVPYTSNFTCSIFRHREKAFDSSRCGDWMDKPSDDELNLSKLIKHHAYQRMQLFYFTALAYWREGCRVWQGATDLQHGRSQCELCSAAHSAILPRVEDDSFERLKQSLKTEGLTPETERALCRLGIPRKDWPKRRGKGDGVHWDALINRVNLKNRKSLITEGLHLYHALNSTVELPMVANECDGAIELLLRERALELINEVSNQGTHPYLALQKFEEALREFLEQALQETREKIACLENLVPVAERVEHYEARMLGPFDRHAFDGYVENIKILSDGRMELRSFNQYSLRRGVRSCTASHNRVFRFFEEGACPASTAFNRSVSMPELQGSAKSPQRRLVSWEKAKETQEGLNRVLREGVALTLVADLKQCLESQREALKIFELQKEGSRSPPFELLSGKKSGGGRTPLTDKELLKHRNQVLLQDYEVSYTSLAFI